MEEKFITKFEDFIYYPFDTPRFDLKFELLHFHLEGISYGFNYLRTGENEFKWKQGCDFLPEFDICYGETHIETMTEF